MLDRSSVDRDTSVALPVEQARVHQGALELQESPLGCNSPTKTAQLAGCPDHAVTGYYDRNRIAAVGTSDSPYCLGASHSTGEFTVADGGPERDAGQFTPDRHLEVRTPAGELKVELLALVGKVLTKLPRDMRALRLGLHRLGAALTTMEVDFAEPAITVHKDSERANLGR